MMAERRADVVEIVVLAADAHHLLGRGRALVVAPLAPRKTSLNWFIPALVKSSVGSSPGTSGELGTTRWPFALKNFEERAADFVRCHWIYFSGLSPRR